MSSPTVIVAGGTALTSTMLDARVPLVECNVKLAERKCFDIHKMLWPFIEAVPGFCFLGTHEEATRRDDHHLGTIGTITKHSMRREGRRLGG
jgi:hypothetical protein